MGFICIDVDGLYFVLQDWNIYGGDNRVSKLFAVLL